MKAYRLLSAVVLLFFITMFAAAQGSGTIAGSVSLKSNGTALHNAAVRIVQLDESRILAKTGLTSSPMSRPAYTTSSSPCPRWTERHNP
jgi:hypothetical protein